MRWGWWLLSAGACGLGVLTKGPVAVLLLVPPLLLQRWLAGDLCRVSRIALLAFLATVAVVALPWYVALCLRLPGFAQHFLWEHNVLRFVAPFDHPRGVWFYVPVVLFGLLPGTLLLASLVRFLFSGKEDVPVGEVPNWAFCSWPVAGVCCSSRCQVASCRPTSCPPFRRWR